jgi:hypothetical protein
MKHHQVFSLKFGAYKTWQNFFMFWLTKSKLLSYEHNWRVDYIACDEPTLAEIGIRPASKHRGGKV